MAGLSSLFWEVKVHLYNQGVTIPMVINFPSTCLTPLKRIGGDKVVVHGKES